MAFTPDSSRRDNQDSCHAYATKMVSSEQRCIHISDLLDIGNFDRVGGENGAKRCAEHCHEG
jgi:hypothetical protein